MKNIIKILESNNLQWGKYNNNEFYIWTPGYKHADCYKLEKIIMDNGYFCLSMSYDKHCCQTLMKFKKQPNSK